MTDDRIDLPGSVGEKKLQERFETVSRADDFYETTMLTRLNDQMKSFLQERNTIFVGCTGNHRTTRVRVRSGDSVVDILDHDRIAWTEPAASNFVTRARDAAHATVMAVDWEDTTVGLHVNGAVRVANAGKETKCVIEVKEAYIHCAKHLPQLERDPESVTENSPLETAADSDLEDLHREFVSDRIFFLLGTADADGETDISPRFGPRGFVQLTERGLAYPEYRGNGVHASLGNMMEVGRACFTFVDLWQAGGTLHVEGDVWLRDDAPPEAEDLAGMEKTKVWVEMEPDTFEVADADVPAYSLATYDPPWGTDDRKLKRAGFFTETP